MNNLVTIYDNLTVADLTIVVAVVVAFFSVPVYKIFTYKVK